MLPGRAGGDDIACGISLCGLYLWALIGVLFAVCARRFIGGIAGFFQFLARRTPRRRPQSVAAAIVSGGALVLNGFVRDLQCFDVLVDHLR